MAAITGKDLLMLCQQPGPRLRASVHVLLILLLAYSLAQLSWRLLPQVEQQPLLPVTALTTKTVVASAANNNLVQQLPGWHLFGEVPRQVVAPQPVDLPETNLKLTLKGLIASPNQDEARAIVADPSGKENFYKVGDKLPGNAELKEIHSDRIVIQRGGRYETLKLPKESLDISSVSSSPASAAIGQNRAARAAAAPRRSYSLRQYRDTLLNDPQKVADLVRIQPANKNGRFAGYKLQPGRDATFMTRYGLLPGDVVTSVNGVELDSPAKGFGLIKDLSSADTLDLVIDRNGVKRHFTLPVN